MFAVIKTGGKQYKVAPSDLIEVASVAGEPGDVVTFDQVLLHGDENGTILGGPLVDGAAVAGEIVGQKRTATILVFKKRRRQNSKRSHGHRQAFTLVRITEILTDGKQPSKAKAKKAAPQPAPAAEAPAAEAAPAVEAAPEAKAAKPKRTTAKASATGEEPAAKPARAPRKKAEADAAAPESAKPARKPRATAAKSEDGTE